MSRIGAIIENGRNLSIHNQQGVELILSFSHPETGLPLDVTDRSVFFEAETGLRIELLPGDEPYQKILRFEQGSLTEHVANATKFIVIDETPALHELHWEGELVVRGW